MSKIKYLPPSKTTLKDVQWLTAAPTEFADFNLVLFFEMNEPVCFKNSLPAMFDLHNRWGLGHGKEADKLKKTFRCFAVSTAMDNWHVNNMRRTKEWIETTKTKGQVSGEYGSRIQELPHPPNMAIGMDLIERRTRNREKLKKMAEKMLYEQPWQHDHHQTPEHTLRILTNYLVSRPFVGKVADANDMNQHTPSFIIFDKEGNTIWRATGNILDVHLRDILLPYLMNVKKAKPLLTQEDRDAFLAEYRASKKYPPGAHVGAVVTHHDGDTSHLYPPPPKEEEAPAEDKKEEEKK